MTDPQREYAETKARELIVAIVPPELWTQTRQDYVADLLLDFAREARLEEAKWWHEMTAAHPGHVCTQTSAANSAECGRIAQLQQPAKKGTQP